MTPRRTTTRHPTEEAAHDHAAKLRRELRGYDPITCVYRDGDEWACDLDLNDSCD
jgi:hypothetical protein